VTIGGRAAVRGGALVMGALVVWNLGNYAFFLLAGRALGPSDYGLVAALLAGTLAIAVPAQALQFATARLVAAPPGGEAALADGIYDRAWWRCALVTPVLAAVACAAVVAAGLVDNDLPVGPLLFTVALIVPLGFFFLALGRLQGEERFEGFSLSFALWGAPRPIFLVILVALGLGVYGALGATGAALLMALAVAMLLTRAPRAARTPSALEWRAFALPLLPVAVGLSGLGLLTNLDVIVARISLDPDAAGNFAAAATLGKAVFLVPQAVSFILLPRVAARTAAEGDTGMLVGFGVVVTLIVGGVASLALWWLAEPILRITYGSDFTVSGGLLGGYAAAATLIGALIVVIIHHVGRGADRFVWATAGIAVAQAALFVVLHGSPAAIIVADAIAGVAGLLLHELIFMRTGEAIVPGFLRAVKRGRGILREGGY
jgi:O-antigen/teichoic acid export membrane protein